MKIDIRNVFLFLGLANFHKPDSSEFDIPDNVLVTFLSLSISHSRALLAKNAKGTKFADLYIPIVNPSEILKQLIGGGEGKYEVVLGPGCPPKRKQRIPSPKAC